MNRAQSLATLAAVASAFPLRVGAQQTEYLIGVTYPLTGPLAPVGAEPLAALKLSLADINRAGGVKGHKLRFDVEDTAGTPEGGVAAMRKVVEVSGAQAVITIYTNVVTAQIPLADQLKVVTITQTETPGLMARSQYCFSHAPTWGETMPLFIAYWKEHHVKHLFGMLTNSAIGQLQAIRLKQVAKQIGASYAEALLDPDATDYSGDIERARAFGADAIVITGQGSTSDANAVRQIRELGIKTTIYSLGQVYDQKAFHDALGPYAEGMIFGGLNITELNSPVTRTFIKEYEKARGFKPAYVDAEAYDIVRIIGHAIDEAGYNGPAMRNAIASLKGFPSVMGGTITMGKDHQTIITAVALWQVRHGTLVRISKIA